MASHRRVGHLVAAGAEIPALFGLRAVAALAVLTTHVGFQTGAAVYGAWAPVLSRLDFGVTLFFLLSGFLLYRPWAARALHGRPPPSTAVYARRRWLRIYPAYVLAVAGAWLLVQGNTDVTAGDWWAHVLLIQVYVDDSAVLGLTQMWSLCVEVAFYAALPVLAWLATSRRPVSEPVWLRRQVVLLAGLVVVATAWNVWVRETDASLPGDPLLWLPGYLDWFAAGMALAVATLWVSTGREGRMLREVVAASRSPWSLWAIAAAVFAVASTPLAGPLTFIDPATTAEALTKHWLYLLAAALLLLPLVLADPSTGPSRWLGARVPYWLGEVSYGIFLWHLVVLDVAYQVTGREPFTGGFWVMLTITVAGTLAVSAVSFRLVERPLITRGHRRPLATPSTASPATTSAIAAP